MTRIDIRRPERALRAATVTAVVAVLIAGCGGTSSEDGDAVGTDPAPAGATASTPDSAPSQAQPTQAPPAGSQSPAETEQPTDVVVPDSLQFEATTVNGDAFDGASIAGRPVVLWFWAPWCSVCKSQAPEISDLAETYGDDIAFVGVGALSDPDSIKAFADDVPGLTHLSDPDGELYQRFGIAEQSSFVVLDAAGNEALRTGYSDDDELAGTVAELAG